jgi:glycosyltransferase involved in cell wall biosynthesis
MSLPLISIVIPTFERPAYLERACKTASKQTYKNIEIIVVDDNSSESYKDALKAVQHLNIKYIKRDKNGGGSAARNNGIEIANGCYNFNPELHARQFLRRLQLSQCQFFLPYAI